MRRVSLRLNLKVGKNEDNFVGWNFVPVMTCGANYQLKISLKQSMRNLQTYRTNWRNERRRWIKSWSRSRNCLLMCTRETKKMLQKSKTSRKYSGDEFFVKFFNGQKANCWLKCFLGDRMFWRGFVIRKPKANFKLLLKVYCSHLHWLFVVQSDKPGVQKNIILLTNSLIKLLVEISNYLMFCRITKVFPWLKPSSWRKKFDSLLSNSWLKTFKKLLREFVWNPNGNFFGELTNFGYLTI